MITIVISAISIVIVVVISIILITMYYDAEKKRKDEMQLLVSDINKVNDKHTQTNNQQTQLLSNVNTSVNSMQSAVRNINTDVIDSKKKLESIPGEYVKKSDISKNMTFDSLNVGKVPLTSDNTTLKLEGSLWTKDGLSSTVNNKYASVVSTDANKIYLNKGNDFTEGVSVGKTMNIDAWKYANDATNTLSLGMSNQPMYTFDQYGRMAVNKTSEKSGMSLPSGKRNGYVDDGQFAKLSTLLPDPETGKNIIRGDTEIQGATMMQDLEGRKIKLREGIASGALELSNNPQSNSYWGMSVKDNKLLFVPDSAGDGMSILFKTNGPVTFDQEGNGMFNGNVTGNSVCSKQQCLSESEIQKLKKIASESDARVCAGTACLTAANVNSLLSMLPQTTQTPTTSTSTSTLQSVKTV